MKICIVDTETTADNTVADFGAVIADLSTGEILDEIGCLIYDQFDEIELWSNPYADKGDFWHRQKQSRSPQAIRSPHQKRLAVYRFRKPYQYLAG